MIKLYGAIALIAILGGIGYGFKYYYDTTQNTIAQLRENNAQLEVAVETATESVNKLQGDIAKMATLNKSLQEDLQKAEAYGDELRAKLSKLNLVVEALKAAKVLEGKILEIKSNFLPREKGVRNTILIEPKTSCPDIYPRGIGKAEKYPLKD